jgi:hypothetical protein
MDAKIKNPIDPRTTRRTVPVAKYDWNAAMYGQYRVIERGATSVILEKKPEFCVRAAR